MRARLIPALAIAAAICLASCGGDDDDESESVKLGDQRVNDHGTENASGKTSIEVEADDFYFEPTFLRGQPGQKLTLKIENEGSAKHNITVAGVDRDIDPGKELEVEITFPSNGVALFICKFHAAQGMAGELLVGDATPGPAAGSSSQPQNPDPY